MADEEARIALFIDHENLVIGAREIGRGFDVGPIMDALAERGRVVARRAYADWTLFAGDRRTLVEHNCELIDIPQRTGAVRKNAADIKLAVDAMELAYERAFVSTFVIASGDSDFTPLVAALRGLNRRVIGIGVKGSTSSLLPPACDEFLFYDRLTGVGEPVRPAKRAGNGGNAGQRPPRRGAKPRKDDGDGATGQRDLQELQRQLQAGLQAGDDVGVHAVTDHHRDLGVGVDGPQGRAHHQRVWLAHEVGSDPGGLGDERGHRAGGRLRSGRRGPGRVGVGGDEPGPTHDESDCPGDPPPGCSCGSRPAPHSRGRVRSGCSPPGAVRW